jgi:TolB-like protein/cytochrome c-type biogenesis protein CcmH/NrfG
MFEPGVRHLETNKPATKEDDGTMRFGRFEVHRAQRKLLADGRPVELGDRAFDVLLALMAAEGAMVGKSELMQTVWPGQLVEENNVAVQVGALRRALGEDRDLIQTVPRRGYRFLGKVHTISDAHVKASAAPPLTIVVLPFVNLRGDPAIDYVVDGITDSLTTDISRAVPGSFVVSLGTAFTYRDGTTDARRIGQELGVRYLLGGSVLIDENQVRVNARLVDTATDRQLWADRFDTLRDKVLAVQDEIVARLSRSVGLQIIDAEARHSDRTRSPEAVDLVMRGWALMNRPTNKDALIEARALFERALSVDPHNTDALAQIGTILVFEVLNGYYDTGRAERLVEADAILAGALANDPNHIAALRARAAMLRARGSFHEAIRAAEAVIAFNPGEPRVYNELGLSWLYLGDVTKAIEFFNKAARVGPRDPARWVWLSGLGRAQIFLEQYALAMQSLQSAVAANPKDFFARVFLAAACALAGHQVEAEIALQECNRLRPGLTIRALSHRLWSVPMEATSPRYRTHHQRLLLGLRKAGMPR